MDYNKVNKCCLDYQYYLITKYEQNVVDEWIERCEIYSLRDICKLLRTCAEWNKAAQPGIADELLAVCSMCWTYSRFPIYPQYAEDMLLLLIVDFLCYWLI